MIQHIRSIVQAFPEVTEEPHFEKISFRVKKKIFATCNQEGTTLTVKLSPEDQNVFSLDREKIHPVANKWGAQGWTIAYTEKLSAEQLNDLLITAFCEVAPKILNESIRPKGML